MRGRKAEKQGHSYWTWSAPPKADMLCLWNAMRWNTMIYEEVLYRYDGHGGLYDYTLSNWFPVPFEERFRWPKYNSRLRRISCREKSILFRREEAEKAMDVKRNWRENLTKKKLRTRTYRFIHFWQWIHNALVHYHTTFIWRGPRNSWWESLPENFFVLKIDLICRNRPGVNFQASVHCYQCSTERKCEMSKWSPKIAFDGIFPQGFRRTFFHLYNHIHPKIKS